MSTQGNTRRESSLAQSSLHAFRSLETVDSVATAEAATPVQCRTPKNTAAAAPRSLRSNGSSSPALVSPREFSTSRDSRAGEVPVLSPRPYRSLTDGLNVVWATAACTSVALRSELKFEALASWFAWARENRR